MGFLSLKVLFIPRKDGREERGVVCGVSATPTGGVRGEWEKGEGGIVTAERERERERERDKIYIP